MGSAKEIDVDHFLERGFLISGALLLLALVAPVVLFIPPVTIAVIVALPTFPVIGFVGTLNDSIQSAKSAGYIIVPAIVLTALLPKFENDPTSFFGGLALILPITWRVNRTRLKWSLKWS